MRPILKTMTATGLAGALALAGTFGTTTQADARNGRNAAIAAGVGLGILGGIAAANGAYYPGYYGYGYGPGYYGYGYAPGYAAPYAYYGPSYRHYGPRYRYSNRHWNHWR